MRLNSFTLILSLSIAWSVQAADDAAKQLQGEWTCSQVEIEGQKHDVAFKIEFKDNELTIKAGDASQRYSVSFPTAPTKGPKPIDLKFLDGPNRSQNVLCIYELVTGSGGGLKLCGNFSGTAGKRGNVRPKDFQSKAGDEFGLVTLVKKSSKK